MKTNLSSQITLTRIPLRYYRPENAFEHSVLTRLEKIPTNIYESAEEGSFAIAKEIATQIRKKQDIGKPFVIALPGGRSPLSVYKELIRMHKEENLSFRNVIAFVEYEFYPLANPSAGNLARLKEELFDQVDIDPANIYCPDGSMPKDAILDFCRQYEETIQSVGGIDCMLLGIGNSSNIMFNVGGTTISSSYPYGLVGRRFPQGGCPYVPFAGECPGRYHHDGYLYDDERPQRDLDGLGRG